RRCDPSGHGNIERSPRYESPGGCDKKPCAGGRAGATDLGRRRMARAEAYMHGPVRQAYLARRIQTDPVSRLAAWARPLAGFAVAVMLLAIIIVRAGILEIVPSLATVGGA